MQAGLNRSILFASKLPYISISMSLKLSLDLSLEMFTEAFIPSWQVQF